eukprot:TRINITY_DN12655_c1_g1_i1.p1 TRINITY_DN12655_c1_g1~~TRINITY_DN12655_c1_g1_i1.p1  ORF type:complete len:319 (-),score=33.72 TRINITY_DN12655_c1_g1_i1:192-1148(-)
MVVGPCKSNVGESVASADDHSSVTTSEAGEGHKGASFAQSLTCFVCNAALGKRKMNPRHHCRICMNSVCSACSPSSIQMENEKQLQRACTPCISNTQKVSLFKDRLVHLNEGLQALRVENCQSDRAPNNIEDAFELCEVSLAALKDYIIEIRAELKSAKQSHDITKATLEETGANLSQVCCELSSAQSRVSDVEAELSKEQEGRSSLVARMSALETHLNDAQTRLAEEQLARRASDELLREASKSLERGTAHDTGLDSSHRRSEKMRDSPLWRDAVPPTAASATAHQSEDSASTTHATRLQDGGRRSGSCVRRGCELM